MYVQELFAEQRPAQLFALIDKHPLGAIVSTRSTGIEVDHVPFVAHPEAGTHGILHCHVARGNPLWRALAENGEVLVVFQGPNAYISPTWMPARKRHAKVAPSWNYAAVHIYGRARVVEQTDWLKQLLRDLSRSQERHRPNGWTLDEAPEDYLAQLLPHIVGIEVAVERIVGKWFVGQQRSPSDREGVVWGLLQERTDAATAVAALMNEYAPAPKEK